VVEDANLVANCAKWIYGTGALRHLCSNKKLMHDFEDVRDVECIFMGNSGTARVMGKGKILLKFTSARLLSLIYMLFMPSLRINLVFGTSQQS